MDNPSSYSVFKAALTNQGLAQRLQDTLENPRKWCENDRDALVQLAAERLNTVQQAQRVLKNGAIEIARLGDVVLAKRDSDYEPWVTWRIDAYGNTVTHYFTNPLQATMSLYDRAGVARPADIKSSDMTATFIPKGNA